MRKFVKKNVLAYCFFDFGLSSFPTLILTFFYGAYYTRIISIDPIIGASYWGYMISLSSFLSLIFFFIILTNNEKKNKANFFKFFFSTIIGSCTLLIFFKEGSNIIFPLILVSIGFISFEVLNFFYNVSLSNVSKFYNIGFISNLGWAFGYLGGLASLAIVLVILNFTDNERLLSLIGPFVGIWTYLFCKEYLKISDKVILVSLSIKVFFKKILQKKILNFILSFFFFQNAVVCTFIFSGIYASQILNFSESEILMLGIFVNLFGIFGCLILGYLETKFETKDILKISLLFLTILSFTLLSFSNHHIFWSVALFIGFFIGPLQASSRAFLSKEIKNEEQYSGFAFYSALGNFCSIVGPFVISKVLILTNSLNISLFLIPTYFLLGFLFFLRIRTNV